MSVAHLAVVLHHSRARGTAKLVLLGIANHEGDGGSWPSHATLATYANVHVDSVRKAIRQLVGFGEVKVYVQEGGDRDCPDELRPNRYEVLVTCPAWCDKTPNHRDTRKLAGKPSALFRRPRDRGALSPRGEGAIAQGGEGAIAQGGEGAIAHQTSHLNQTHQVVSQPQDARASLPPCEECSAPNRLVCDQRQSKLAKADRHEYRPIR